ncbi:unnamed protein product [Cladocopium goreaui]|uniref:EF-hand domain-containing protein n=1 Tax=Cladocopium goreaui TaxID=2562237 RepID=A0A9P1BVM2_9DINO|nr:unnamed protein product [Cladocopium goreaui]
MGQSVQKVPAREMWLKLDQDQSGVLDRKEADTLLRLIWKTYKVQKPLSAEVVTNILAELDVNKDGKIVQKEFEELYDGLWEEMVQVYASPKAGSQAAGTSPTSKEAGSEEKQGSSTPPKSKSPKENAKANAEPNHIRCPHCAFEIDPRHLQRLKVPPEALSVAPGPWQGSSASAGYQAMPAISAAPVPPGTSFHGQVPASFFQTSHGWWAQSNGPS